MPIPSDWPPFWTNQHFPGIVGEFVKADGLVFDIGANIGKMTWMYRTLNARVVAVEPQIACINKLQETFVDDENVLIVHAACGAVAADSVEMSCYGGTTISTFVPDHYWGSNGPWKGTPCDWKESVKMVTVDDLIAQCGVPDFIKIDVEGYEHQVLCGLNQFIPLSFEFHPIFREQAFMCMARILQLEPEARFANTNGESLVLEGDWCGYSEMRGRIDSLLDRYGKAYFGNIYARKVV